LLFCEIFHLLHFNLSTLKSNFNRWIKNEQVKTARRPDGFAGTPSAYENETRPKS
jgi:hypothetical protein